MTKAERWKAVEELFHRAIDVPETDRARFLAAESGGDQSIVREVESLIASDSQNAGGSLAAATVKKALATFHAVETAATAPGRRVGRYRLIKEIGRGGMGAVYLATRDDDTYRKNVAIKLVRRGMDTDFILARFRRERQILASLEHPNIARLLDGGATDDGLPYLVMECVQGVTITEYTRQNDLALEQRLRLFLQVCDAVEYAHRNFVVHRDLKPGNILVDGDGNPKLLDFGISKLLTFDGSNNSETITQGVRMLTPDYASPEQIRGEPITAAADVYSLGAILFELITDEKPHRIGNATPQDVEKAICEEDVQRPSEAARAEGNVALARKLQGDLDNIVLLAMRKEAKRRYASVHDFSADIRRYLNYKPVSARPDTVIYRTQKFVRRNWGPLVAIASVIAVLMVGVLMARREARVARLHFLQVRKLANTFVTGIHDEVKTLPGSTKARQMIVSTGLEYLQNLAKNAEGDIDLQREIGGGYMRIGDVQGSVLEANLGDTKGALESYRKALQLLEAVARERPHAVDVQADILTIHRRIGDIYGYTKSTDAALRSYSHARAVGETLLAKQPGDLALIRNVADLYQAQGRTLRLADDSTRALAASNRAIDLYKSVSASLPADLVVRREMANALSAAGMALARLARRDEALAYYRESVRQFELLVVREPENTAALRGLMLAYSHVGDLLSEAGLAKASDLPEAQQMYQKMAAVAERLHKADGSNYRALSDRGIALMRLANVTEGPERLRRFTEALGFMKQAGEGREDLVLHMNQAYVQTKIADILREQGNAAEANRHYREAVASNERIIAADAKNGSARKYLIEAYRRLGEDAAARKSKAEARQIRDRLLQIAEGAKALNGPPRVQMLVAKGHAAAAAVSAALDETQSARLLYENAVGEYRALQSQPGFAWRKELHESEAALGRLRR
jgi:tetratricopeptide (TPR) repeat protein/tRNA A-37 threonylcarbamoyl transferase component Bud32